MMKVELLVMGGVAAYGAAQALLAGPVPAVQQIHRNFSETAYLFFAVVLALAAIEGFGPWSHKGAVVYAIGRGAYLALSFGPLRRFRKWAWATSIAGIVGCLGELARAVLQLLA